MRISYMEVECSRVRDQHRISNNSMLHMVSKDINSKVAKELKTKAKRGPSLLRSRC